MASNQQQYDEQLKLLQERFPTESRHALLRQLEKNNGDVDQVRAHFFQREFRHKKLESLETRYGSTLNALQQEYPSSHSLKRSSLLKTMERFGGETEYVRQYLERLGIESDDRVIDPDETKEQQRERLRKKYAVQLAELSSAGINIKCPCVLTQLEKNHGDVHKILEIMTRHKEKKDKIYELDLKYKDQIAQLEADGVKVKNKQYLLQLLDKADGQIDKVKELLAERNEQKHSINSSSEGGEKKKDASLKKQHSINIDDLDHIKQLRAAGIHGNPVKILAVFHECNDSIELTIARFQKEREEREEQSEKRLQQRISLAEIHDSYLNINHQNDWPNDIEQVYLDGNNMMFVIDTLRQLCLNRASQKTERAIAQIANAWNEQMCIPNVELIFDSTHQLDQIGSIKVTSAHPTYSTTDDMLIDIARRTHNHEKNKHTIIVTSDRARHTGILLKHEGCQLVKSYAWFAHCAMILTPDLINEEESSSTDATPKSRKSRYNLDELVHRIAQID
ncbi:hypothetical protein I4U23_024685 [Adineta vaga]|nr:hypothetical protein I4U23_024685 [Adineta vaga]